jgi:tetratricopeptide (TPR) repeat protein
VIPDYDAETRLEYEGNDAYMNRGSAYDEIGKFELAIQDYYEAIRRDLEYVFAYSNRGFTYYQIGQLERSVQDLSEPIRLKPQFGNPHAVRA